MSNVAKVTSVKTHGIDAVRMTVEAQVSNGIGIHLVGLADQAVKESLLRTVTALQSNGFHIPGKKVVINLAPADIRMGASEYDLPIALGVIVASGQRDLPDIGKYVIAGELGLDGSVREVMGWMQAAELAKSLGLGCILPTESAKLAARALGRDVNIYGVDTLSETIDILTDGAPEWTAMDDYENDRRMEESEEEENTYWDSIKGQPAAQRALEIAAAGGHPVLLMGIPGSGKLALAKSLREILPPMSEEEMLEVQRIYSTTKLNIAPGVRPYRSPHISASLTAMLGGGSGERVLPGEVSLAHNGVFCLQDFNEAPKSIMEGMRAVLEDGKVTISRLRDKVEYPARFLPVFTTLPCPCGYYGDGDRCKCTAGQREAFHARMNGPVMDMITMQVFVTNPKAGAPSGQPRELVAERVAKARKIQLERQGKLNNELTDKELGSERFMSQECLGFVGQIFVSLGLSLRSYTGIARMARTIADLEGCEEILPYHIAEAASYRFLDKRDAFNRIGNTNDEKED